MFLLKERELTGTASKRCATEWTTAHTATKEHVEKFLRADLAFESATTEAVCRETW